MADGEPLSMSLIKKIGIILASLTVLVVIADLIGVAVCFSQDFSRHSGWSWGAIYALWFVLGVVVGLFQYFAGQGLCSSDTTADPKNTKHSKSIGVLTILVSTLTMAAFSYIFYLKYWIHGADSSDGYIPDSMNATMTFFGSIVTAMVFTAWVSSSDGSAKEPKKKKK
jgi:hypothetical protein